MAKLRYSGNEYFWINDLHPTMLMHPIKPELNGKDLSGFKDPNGFHLFVAFAEKGKTAEGEGFVPYLWPKPGSPESGTQDQLRSQFQTVAMDRGQWRLRR
ncbi:cache domain-containing protein [Bdellovibrio bacteriovorus]|uniref:cache domain-containing protein n=1 Tax=Bdellovibrio bacteriovorus TaxID=959 RepID=UPI0035A6C812